MKAIVMKSYGTPDVLELAEVETPTPKANEVLVRVCASSINDWDWGVLHGKPFVNRMMNGLRTPRIRILGGDIAGRVETVGSEVKAFQPGDEVYGDLCMSGFGAFAEYACAPETCLVHKPSTMSFEQAAAIPQAGMLAVQGLIDVGRIQAGQRLLLNGAGGGVGTFALQMARALGVEVTAVDKAEKLEFLRSMGATHVVDYLERDFTASGERYDLILDVKSNRSPSSYARALSPHGSYVTVGGESWRLLQVFLLGPLLLRFRKKRVCVVALKPNKDLTYMNEQFEAGAVVPVIAGPYELADVPEALRFFGTGDHLGKIVVRVP